MRGTKSCILFVPLFVLSSIALSIASSANAAAASVYDNAYHTTDKLRLTGTYYGVDEDISTDWSRFILEDKPKDDLNATLFRQGNNNMTTQQKEAMRASFKNARNWTVSNYCWQSGEYEFCDVYVLWSTEPNSMSLEWQNNKVLANGHTYIVRISQNSGSAGDTRTEVQSGVGRTEISQQNFNGTTNHILNFIANVDNINYPDGYQGQLIQDNYSIPINLSVYAFGTVKDKSTKKGDISAFFDKTQFKTLYPDVPVPSNVTIFLTNANHDIFPPTMIANGGSNWTDLPFGDYRIHAFAVPNTQDGYSYKDAVIDVRLDEHGFLYRYSDEDAKYCMIRQTGHLDGFGENAFKTDPNTGSWLTPGTMPLRCDDVDQPGDKQVSDAFEVGYNFDELVPCDTLDLACHLSRLVNSISSLILGTLSYLFIPEKSTIELYFKSTYATMLDSFGFLAYPFHIFVQFFNMLINPSANPVGDKCNIGSITFNGSSANLELCAWRYQWPQLWTLMQSIIQGGIGLGFAIAYYRKLMAFFGYDVGSDDDGEDTSGYEWYDDRTGERGSIHDSSISKRGGSR